MKDEDNFKVMDIIPNVGLMGMSLYYGSLNIDLSKLGYVNKPDVSVPKDILQKVVNGESTPILISSKAATQFLFYYKGEWLKYVEKDI